MSEPRGRSRPVSYFRRLVIDLMHFSRKVPAITIERRMDLSALSAARASCTPAPTWSALFIKAFALMGVKKPLLRTSFMPFPWARFYENRSSIAALSVDREVDGERIVLFALVSRADNRSLRDIDAIIREHQTKPLDEIKSYQASLMLSKLPKPIRRFVWWWGLNVYGSSRCHKFGTFGITSVCSKGSGMVRLVPLVTYTLHYGMMEADGSIKMRLTFDHRVLDGATAADLLKDMEATLRGAVLAEVEGLAGGLRLAA